ncbi:hypothetical protein BDQ12DRAFT_684143 [Crucibulum laeve]|uniref:Uncharacterized protein n=1 Tax=Crucibulum laeve TaxID=68775 RepID=A0A5C3LZ21_9AGAR|nr:hypothetical protein BDQ12DRAFT_684143 [Crucibulum laeve]
MGHVVEIRACDTHSCGHTIRSPLRWFVGIEVAASLSTLRGSWYYLFISEEIPRNSIQTTLGLVCNR